MQKKPREMEKIILADGWIFQAQVGSHRHYIHPSKSGKVTIPFHFLYNTSSLKQAIILASLPSIYQKTDPRKGK